MKKLKLFKLLVSVLVVFGASNVFAGAAKVEVCHLPPGNSDNFHTITINENALATHLAHGDIAGPCDAACATLCDDGDACTIDDTGDCEQFGCPASRQTVDCDDSNDCTADSCNSTSGCVNTAQVGQTCDDGLTCTGVDACDSTGKCTGPAIPNCCLTDDDCGGDLCAGTFCNTATNLCVDDPVVCTPPDLCHVSVCDTNDGTCAETPITCPTGEHCGVTGECVPDTDCPCFDTADLDLQAQKCSTRSGVLECRDSPTAINTVIACASVAGGTSSYTASSSNENTTDKNCTLGGSFTGDPNVSLTGLTDEQKTACLALLRQQEVCDAN